MLKAAYLLSAVILLSLSPNSGASSSSKSRRAFCSDRESSNYIKSLAQTRKANMSFLNRGGIGNAGVCWWHSRFVRNALYLTYYRNDLQRPSERQAKKLIKKIRKGKSVVMIPGFKDFREFSREYKDLIQKQLEKWQLFDGLIAQQWVVGLSGKSEVKEEKLQSMMDDLYSYVVGGKNIAYQKLQIKGIDAHAWLVVDMKKRAYGYDLYIIDSNFYKAPIRYTYNYGDTHFTHPDYGNFVPYLEKEKELRRLKKTVTKFCR